MNQEMENELCQIILQKLANYQMDSGTPVVIYIGNHHHAGVCGLTPDSCFKLYLLCRTRETELQIISAEQTGTLKLFIQKWLQALTPEIKFSVVNVTMTQLLSSDLDCGKVFSICS